VSAVTPSSSPFSSMIFPSLSFNIVIPVKCIFLPDAAGNEPTRKSLKAGLSNPEFLAGGSPTFAGSTADTQPTPPTRSAQPLDARHCRIAAACFG